jgi:hypothetical protein
MAQRCGGDVSSSPRSAEVERCRMYDSRCRGESVQGLGFRKHGLRLRDLGSGSMV